MKINLKFYLKRYPTNSYKHPIYKHLISYDHLNQKYASRITLIYVTMNKYASCQLKQVNEKRATL